MMHILQSTAWTLIHFCWQAAAIAGLYAVAARAAEHRTSQFRYVLALSAMFALLITGVFTFAYESSRGVDASAPYITAASARGTGDFPRIAEPGVAPNSANAISESTDAPAPAFMLWIDSLWVVGVFGLALRHLGGWLVISRLRNRALQPAPVETQNQFARIAAALGLGKRVALRISEAIAGPVTVGAFRSMVLLPLTAVTGLSKDELEVVLAHELAHVRRADFLWNVLQCVVETLFFFHPAVWWVSNRVRQERELCCDDMALEICPDRVVYANALFRLEQERATRMHLAMALDGHQPRTTLRNRIARILGEPEVSRKSARPVSLAAVAASAIVLAISAPQLVAGLHPVQAETVAASPDHSIPAPSANAAEPATASAPVQDAAPRPSQQPAKKEAQPAADSTTDAQHLEPSAHTAYIDRMKAAGYDVDLDKLIAMKIQNVTPEYAQAMSQLGLGKPSADDLIACKIQGVSPEVVAELKKDGLDVKSFQDAISDRIFHVDPEFVAGMKAAGFDHLTSQQLLSLRVQGVTPEYAKSITQQFPGITADELVETRIFHIDADFIASAKSHGFTDLTLKKLVKLRISGILDDTSK
jgi:beta-lactamase regulating signal transducer with metallopeptidase domain